MIYQIAVALAVVASTSALYTEDVNIQKNLWANFKGTHGKKYETEAIEAAKFATFLENLKVVDKRNGEEKGAVHGITQFSDMTQDEFEKQFLLSKPELNKFQDSKIMTPYTENYQANSTSGFVDWTGRLTTAVKNQGSCGSCWAFSATEQIETDAMRTLGVYYELAPGQINACDGTSYGCNGGWTENAYNYVHNAGGIETEGDYPYNGGQGGCHANGGAFKIAVNSYTKLTSNIENSMGGFVSQAGPLSICLDASNFNSYTGGVMWSCGKSVNHCVQAVGVQVDGYWKVRNQWGTGWGEGGFIRLGFGQNVCNLASTATYVNVSRK